MFITLQFFLDFVFLTLWTTSGGDTVLHSIGMGVLCKVQSYRGKALSDWNPAGTLGYRNGTESFFGLKGRPSGVRDVNIHNQPVLRMRRK
jgi:hypothetical protein